MADDINIISPDTHGDILVALIKGQERAATELRLQNTRLFGGDGQQGAIPFIVQQHKELVEKLDKNKDELVEKIEETRTTLTDKIDATKKETDKDIKDLTGKHNKLDKKVNWYSGGLAALGVAATLVTGWLGIHVARH